MKMIQEIRKTNTMQHVLQQREDIRDFLLSHQKLNLIFDLIDSDIDCFRIDQYKKIYDGIGNTGYYHVKLPNDNTLHIKLEYLNPMGNSHYSRFWIIYLFLCEVLGLINPIESEIIEVSSGSSGIALALACEALGYKATILVPQILPESRVKPMERSGITIVKVNGYINECVNLLRKKLISGHYFATNHSEEKADVIVNVFSRIAEEITCDLNSHIDHVFLAMGNGTSTLALTKRIKELNRDAIVSAYHPDFDHNPNEIVFGLITSNIDCRHVLISKNFVDEICFTSGVNLSLLRDYYSYDSEILTMGPSSLYGLYFAHRHSLNVEGQNFVSIGYDKINRY